MSDQHPKFETLISYIEDICGEDVRSAVAAHLETCAACRGLEHELRVVEVSLHDEETWWLANELPSLAESARRLEQMLVAEDAEAEALLGPMLSSPYKLLYGNLPSKAKFRTGGVARLLTLTAERKLESEPDDALIYAETACVISEALPHDLYPADAVYIVRGNAWRAYANACRLTGRFDAGHDAVRRAQLAYEQTVVSPAETAGLEFIRATLFFEQQRLDDAELAASEVASWAATSGDTRRWTSAMLLLASIAGRRNDLPVAIRTFEQLYSAADTLGDVSLKARAANNLAYACKQHGDLARASEYFLIALALFEDLGLRTEVVRARWGVATIPLKAGDSARALPLLLKAERDCEEAGMQADANRVRLDIAEVYLNLGRYEDVARVCRKLVESFRRAEMVTGALTAAKFLSRAARMRQLKHSHIEHVRIYLERADGRTHVPFEPPTET